RLVCDQRDGGTELVARRTERFRMFDLCLDGFQRWRPNPTGGGVGTASRSWRRWAVDLRRVAVLDHQRPRRDKTGNTANANIAQQAEDVAIDRLLPEVLSRLEVTTDQRRTDAPVDCSAIESDQPTLAVAGHADRKCLCRLVVAAPVDESKRLLHLVADD